MGEVAERLPGQDWPFGASAGWALAPGDGRRLCELLATADKRMYAEEPAAKRGSLPEQLQPLQLPGPRQLENGSQWPFPASLGAAGCWLLWAAAVFAAAFYDPHGNRPQLVALALACLLLSTFPIVGSRLALAPLRRLSDVAVVPALAAAIYLSGGAFSPLLPHYLAVATFSAQLARPAAALRRLALFTAVVASPFLYGSGEHRIGYLVPFIALATTACVLTGSSSTAAAGSPPRRGALWSLPAPTPSAAFPTGGPSTRRLPTPSAAAGAREPPSFSSTWTTSRSSTAGLDAARETGSCARSLRGSSR